MPVEEIKTKQLKLTLKEFQDTFGIKGKITSVSYYGARCDKDTEDPYIEIDIDVS